MGPAPSWLYLLLIFVLIIDNAILVVSIRHWADYLPIRKHMALSSSGAVLALSGRGLEHVTRGAHGWLNSGAWVLWAAGLILVLISPFFLVRTDPKDRAQRKQQSTDPAEVRNAMRKRICLLAAPLSVGMIAMTQSSSFGYVIGGLMLFLSIGLPLALWCDSKAGNSIS